MKVSDAHLIRLSCILDTCPVDENKPDNKTRLLKRHPKMVNALPKLFME
jgi:hypothetical protein